MLAVHRFLSSAFLLCLPTIWQFGFSVHCGSVQEAGVRGEKEPQDYNMASAILALYSRAHASHPLLLSQALGFSIAVTGDAACQHLVEGAPSLNPRRLLDMGLVRSLLMAPVLFFYFPLLAKTLPGSSWPRVVGRVAIDAAVASPLVTCATFAAFSALQGKPEDAVPRIQSQLLPTWATGLCYWPFIHLANFRFVAAPHQALVAHCASVPWNVVLSYRSNIRLAEKEAAAEAVVV